MKSVKVVIRDSMEGDTPAVKRFFLENHSDYNKVRGDAVLLNRIQAHHFVIIELNKAIVGVAGTFRHGTDGIYREAGATRITLNGFGLQRITHFARSLHEHFIEPGYRDYYSTVADENKASKHNLEKVGFVSWLNPPEELTKFKRSMIAPHRKIDFMRLPIEQISEHATSLLNLADDPKIPRKHPSDHADYDLVDLDLRLAILEHNLKGLEKLANQTT